MSDAPSVLTDPFAIARRAYEQTADAFTRTVEIAASNPYFAAASGQVLNGYLALQETFRASVNATIAALQNPFGSDDSAAAGLAERVAAVETALGALVARTEALARAVEKTPGPDTAVIDRLVRIESRIEALRATAERPSANGLGDRLDAIEKKLDGLKAPAPIVTPAAPEKKIVKATSVTPEAIEAPADPVKKPRAATPRAKKDTPAS